ncbi:MAG: DegT/DnrJ/EryC1/StrS family aminotransferase [Planctomycetes bacterium]|nr:DegT/DnrJ/EryC1/StrS family aminotransferase [Planctomycetota bacterium]
MTPDHGPAKTAPGAPAKLPFHDLRASFLAQRDAIRGAVERVLDGGWYILGREVAAFEEEFARFCGAKHALGIGNATEALQVALLALDVKPGDDVVVPALTAAPTGMAVCAVGARPVFADIDPATFTVTAATVERALTPRTKVVIPVHLYGQCAEMEPLLALARSRGLPLLEDCAQCQGAKDEGRPAGTMGVAGAWSFYPTKNLGAFGDGGALTCQDDALAARMKRLRNYGAIEGYDFVEPGLNARLDELHAAILRVKLATLAANNDQRRATAARYRAEIRNPAVTLPIERPGAFHVWHQFVVRCAARDRLRAHLAERGLETLIHYPRAMHQMQAFVRHGHAPVEPREAARAAAEILSLPIYPELPTAQVDAVIAAVNAFRG